ncbi:MAG: translation initiation factor IF-1 [Verrucomicrobiales bacterium]|jgi:translation initiation factor IF-1
MPPPKKRGGRGRGRSAGRGQRPRKEAPTPEQAAEQCFEVEGAIAAVLAGTMFRVKLDGSEHTVLAHISGKMRKRFIRLVIGDRVKLEMSPYDTDKARIVYRLR